MRYTFIFTFSLDSSQTPYHGKFDSLLSEMNASRMLRLGYYVIDRGDEIEAAIQFNKIDFRALEHQWENELLFIQLRRVTLKIENAIVAAPNQEHCLDAEYNFDRNGQNFTLLAIKKKKVVQLSSSYSEKITPHAFMENFVEQAKVIRHAAWQTKLFQEAIKAAKGQNSERLDGAMRLMELSIFKPISS